MKAYWNKTAGIAALFQALSYIIGFTFMLTVLQGTLPPEATPVQRLAHLLSISDLYKAWNVVIYVMFGAVLVVLVVALHQLLARAAPALMPVASAFGLIWAGLVIASGMIANVGLALVGKLYVQDATQASLAWQTLGAVQDGLGGGVELVGGLWVILLSFAALRLASLPRLLNYVGIVTGLAGVLTIIPPLAELGAVFGLGQIAWFIWLGIVMLRSPLRAA